MTHTDRRTVKIAADPVQSNLWIAHEKRFENHRRTTAEDLVLFAMNLSHIDWMPRHNGEWTLSHENLVALACISASVSGLAYDVGCRVDRYGSARSHPIESAISRLADRDALIRLHPNPSARYRLNHREARLSGRTQNLGRRIALAMNAIAAEYHHPDLPELAAKAVAAATGKYGGRLSGPLTPSETKVLMDIGLDPRDISPTGDDRDEMIEIAQAAIPPPLYPCALGETHPPDQLRFRPPPNEHSSGIFMCKHHFSKAMPVVDAWQDAPSLTECMDRASEINPLAFCPGANR